MRHLLLFSCFALLTAAGVDAATINGQVWSRDPSKPSKPLVGFQIRVTQPGVASPLYTSPRQNLPETGATALSFTINIPTLTLGKETEVVMTFTADGRTPARLELAGNQDQTLALVMPVVPTPPPVVETYYPCPPVYYYIESCPPARHRFSARRCR